MKQCKLFHIMGIIFIILLILILGVIIFIHQPNFGAQPSGERMTRIQQSEHYYNGKFNNLETTPLFTGERRGRISGMISFLFRKNESLRPEKEMEVVKTDVSSLDRNQDIVIWFGHSSCMIQQEGKRILVDPVFCTASPVSFINKPFKGTDVYKPQDIPPIDYLIITHDHWDHLDYETVKNLRDRVTKVICGLGVGAHFERWGYRPEQLVELDWNQHAVLDSGFIAYCLPSRHFSGRSFSSDKTLWASFLIQSPSRMLYIAGDGGYGKHYKIIGEQFPNIDLAILENGQYNQDWKYIHLMPEFLVKTANDLKAKKILTVHHSKYALSRHRWDEPLKNIAKAKKSVHTLNPKIGEVIHW